MFITNYENIQKNKDGNMGTDTVSKKKPTKFKANVNQREGIPDPVTRTVLPHLL